MKQALLLIMSIIAYPAVAQENGRYTVSTNGDAVGIWVIDTQTGEVKYCWPTRLNDGEIKANCTVPTK